MANADQNHKDIQKTLEEWCNSMGMDPSDLHMMGNSALALIAAELRTIRQLLEEKAK